MRCVRNTKYREYEDNSFKSLLHTQTFNSYNPCTTDKAASLEYSADTVFFSVFSLLFLGQVVKLRHSKVKLEHSQQKLRQGRSGSQALINVSSRDLQSKATRNS